MTEIDTKRLRKIAEKPRQVRWVAAYSEDADDDASATVVEAEKQHIRVCFPTSDGDPAVMEHIAAFDPPTCLALLDALEQARGERDQFRRERAELLDKLNGTPCAEIRWQDERDELRAARAEAEARIGELERNLECAESDCERFHKHKTDYFNENRVLRARLAAAAKALREARGFVAGYWATCYRECDAGMMKKSGAALERIDTALAEIDSGKAQGEGK